MSSKQKTVGKRKTASKINVQPKSHVKASLETRAGVLRSINLRDEYEDLQNKERDLQEKINKLNVRIMKETPLAKEKQEYENELMKVRGKMKLVEEELITIPDDSKFSYDDISHEVDFMLKDFNSKHKGHFSRKDFASYITLNLRPESKAREILESSSQDFEIMFMWLRMNVAKLRKQY